MKDSILKEICENFSRRWGSEYEDEFGYVLNYCVRNKVHSETHNEVTCYILTKEDIFNLICRTHYEFSVYTSYRGDEYITAFEVYSSSDEDVTNDISNVIKLYNWLIDCKNSCGEHCVLFVKDIELLEREELPSNIGNILDHPMVEVSYTMDFQIYLSVNGRSVSDFYIKDNKTMINGKYIKGFNFERIDNVWYVNYYAEEPVELPMVVRN